MSYNGYRRSVSRPTDKDIYNDAAKILEELLDKRINRNLRVPGRAKRNKSDPNALRVNIQASGDVALISKAGKMRPSKSLDNELETSDLNILRNKSYKQNNKIVAQGGSESSIDTDCEQTHDLDQRKKKSLFKRAKERLRHAFNNQQNKELNKTTNKSSDTSLSIRHNKKNKQEDKDEALPKINVEAGDNRPVQHEDKRNSAVVIQKGIHSPKKGGGLGLISFRSTKRSLSVEESADSQNDKKGQTSESLRDTNGNRADETIYISGDNLSGQYPPAPPPPPPRASPLPSTPLPQALTSNQEPEINSTLLPSPPFPPSCGSSTDQSHNLRRPSPSHLRQLSPQPQGLPSQSRSPSLSLKRVNAGALVDQSLITGAASSSSCTILQPDNTSDGSVENVYSSSHSNVLDSPGEDIEYMDDVPSGVAGNVGVERVATTGPTSDGPPHAIRGLKTSGHSAETLIISNNSEEDEHDEMPCQSQSQDPKKDDIYGKIALKLIELGDLYSVSDHELEGAAASQPPSLSDLEKEIIDCLRTGGDRNSKQMDESFQEFTQQTTQEAYQRFHITMQNSIGNDLSWNHLALLFYTTKGVVSAVGSGSRSASRAKEFTLQYISDTFASWIMDQGGFDSVLSSAESDFDVD